MKGGGGGGKAGLEAVSLGAAAAGAGGGGSAIGLDQEAATWSEGRLVGTGEVRSCVGELLARKFI